MTALLVSFRRHLQFLVFCLSDMDKYDNLGGPDPREGLRYFTGWVVLAQVCGLGAVILIAVWMGHYQVITVFSYLSTAKQEYNALGSIHTSVRLSF